MRASTIEVRSIVSLGVDVQVSLLRRQPVPNQDLPVAGTPPMKRCDAISFESG